LEGEISKDRELWVNRGESRNSARTEQGWSSSNTEEITSNTNLLWEVAGIIRITMGKGKGNPRTATKTRTRTRTRGRGTMEIRNSTPSSSSSNSSINSSTTSLINILISSQRTTLFRPPSLNSNKFRSESPLTLS